MKTRRESTNQADWLFKTMQAISAYAWLLHTCNAFWDVLRQAWSRLKPALACYHDEHNNSKALIDHLKWRKGENGFEEQEKREASFRCLRHIHALSILWLVKTLSSMLRAGNLEGRKSTVGCCWQRNHQLAITVRGGSQSWESLHSRDDELSKRQTEQNSMRTGRIIFIHSLSVYEALKLVCE